MPQVGRIGDTMACGDPISQGSPNVFINGIAVGRLNDGTAGHGNWVPNYMSEGSSTVFANSIPVCRVGDMHIGHLTYDNKNFHRTPLAIGSPNVTADGE